MYHRLCIGLFNSYKTKCRGMSRSSGSTKRFVYYTAAAACIMLYFYILLFLMMMLLDVSLSSHGNSHIEYVFPTDVSSRMYHNEIVGHFLNSLFLTAIDLLFNFIVYNIPSKSLTKLVYKYNKLHSTFTKLSRHIISIWLVSLNLLLIIVANPGIVNPGPNQNIPKISVLFQNIRGLIPFTELGEPSPMLRP